MDEAPPTFLEGLKRRFAAGSFARNLALLTSGTAIGQLIVMASSPVLARLYTEEDFGILSVYFSVVTILSSVSSLRLEQAIPMPDNDEDASLLLRLSLWISLWFSLAAGVVIWLLRGPIARWNDEPELVRYLWLVPVTLLGFGIYRSLTTWGVRKEIFHDLAATRVQRALGQVLVQVGLGFVMHGSFGLILGNAAGQWSGITRLLRPVLEVNRRYGKRRGDFRRLWARYIKFPLYSSPSALLVTIPRQIPNLLFVDYFGVGEAGFLFFASRILRQPAALLSESISQVFLGRAARLLNENPRGLRHLYFSTVRRMLLVSLLPAVFLIVASPWLVQFLFGERWAGSVFYIQVLSVMLIAEVTVSSTSPIMSVLEKQDWQLWGDLLRTLAVVASLMIPHELGWNSSWTILSYAGTMIVCYLFYFAIFSRAVLLKSRELPAPGRDSQ
ncbi:MAG: oligosaccharide flippase family protein [bacterium]